ncbi:MAG TPA: LamG-like jellyroll fold domain-containing protein [Bacteroidia bacterium]|nr:LamG-like jellyroll fold domain-containing protein [Bacteroidia bacterium]
MKKITSHSGKYFFITAFSLFFMLNVSAQNIDSTVAACYPFDGNALDRSGYGHHGTVIGATLSNDRFGNPNSCYYFNGSSDYIAVPVFGTIVPTDEITISFWAKSDSSDYSSAFILSPDDNNDRFSISVDYIFSSSNAVYWDYGDIFTGGRCANLNLPFISQWAHYVCTSSASQNAMQVFKDASVVASCNTHSTIVNRSRTLFIGGDGLTLQHYHGFIDDVRIYNRVLSSSEIADLFNNAPICPLQVGINEMPQENLFALFPNPASSVLTVSLAGTSDYIVSISNAMGQILFQTQAKKQLFVDVKAFPAGIYFVTVADGKKNTAVKKLVKM